LCIHISVIWGGDLCCFCVLVHSYQWDLNYSGVVCAWLCGLCCNLHFHFHFRWSWWLLSITSGNLDLSRTWSWHTMEWFRRCFFVFAAHVFQWLGVNWNSIFTQCAVDIEDRYSACIWILDLGFQFPISMFSSLVTCRFVHRRRFFFPIFLMSSSIAVTSSLGF